MLGSANSIATTNIMLNAAVAESLKVYADRLEGAEDFETALHEMIKKTIKDHKRIIFNGNGYDDAWIKEATETRKLLNLRTTPDAYPTLLEKKNTDMLTSHKVFSMAEIKARYETGLENYAKTVNIEGLTMVDMAVKEIIPAIDAYVKDLSESVAVKKSAVSGISCKCETALIKKLSLLEDEAYEAAEKLETALEDITKAAFFIRDTVIPDMAELRRYCDEAETLTAKKYWPFPTYGDLMFGVK